MPILDGRPPLLDAWFRPGNTFTARAGFQREPIGSLGRRQPTLWDATT